MALGGLTRGYGGDAKSLTPSVECRLTFEGRLREEKAQLEKRLTDVNAVLESLKKAPQVAEVLEALNKLGY